MKALVLTGSPLKRGNTAAALLITHGYPPEKGRGLFQGGVRRCCKYSGLRHPGYDAPFMDEEKELRTRKFAGELLKNLWPPESAPCGPLSFFGEKAEDFPLFP